MFRDSLLDSSPALRRRKRWTVATAFVTQSIVVAALIIVPLLTTGALQLKSAVPIFVPTLDTPIPPSKPTSSTPTRHATPLQPTTEVVNVVNGRHLLDNPYAKSPIIGDSTCTTKCDPPDLASMGNGSGSGLPNFDYKYIPKRQERLRISEPSEAMLVHKVVPVYPQIAIRTGITGTVKLHALIARDGSIQSLNVISGHPLLARAAIEAVEQWQYKPYVLNGQEMEVETYITVTFTRGN